MTDQAGKYEHFLALHQGPAPLLLPNAWDRGSAALLASLGFEAIATTSSGFAATLGQLDNSVTRDQALEHSRIMAAAVSIPVSADLENCFADDPAGVSETVRLATGTGLAGCSVEDSTGRDDDPIYEPGLAADRVTAAVEAAHGSGPRLVLTARAENFLHGRPDLKDTIARLQSYQAAGADVLYAPGLTDAGRHPGRGQLGRPPGERADLRGHAGRGQPGRGRGPPDLGRRGVRLRGLRSAGRCRPRTA